MIDVSRLKKKYGSTVVLDDISFSVGKGEVLGFLGPNGAGKTTTMKILSCFMPATSGSVTIAGLDTVSNSLAIREKIGYLPENNPLYEEINVSEYLSFICDIRGITHRNSRLRIGKVVEMCGLRSVFKKEIGELSKGFRQRVGLAQVLVHDPHVLILDEPTSGLDPNQVMDIRRLINDLGEEKTVMLSTHILQEVAATCARVIIINDGKIVASDTPEELERKVYGELVLLAHIRGPVEDVKRELLAIEHVKMVNVEELDDVCRYSLKISDDISQCEKNRILELISSSVVKKGWKLRELREKTKTLEGVFQRLTV